jgi:hypothetical protein
MTLQTCLPSKFRQRKSDDEMMDEAQGDWKWLVLLMEKKKVYYKNELNIYWDSFP